MQARQTTVTELAGGRVSALTLLRRQSADALGASAFFGATGTIP
jgi:hypothetical protein